MIDMVNHQTVLITGGAGFVGSNLAVAFKNRYPSSKVVVLDNLKRRGSELNLKRLKENEITFIHGDIRNRDDLDFDFDFDLLLECSAEPSVLAGYDGNPDYVINTNLFGTINCLELARKNKADVIFFSTSRVYPFNSINDIATVENDTRLEWDDQRQITGWSSDGIDVNFALDGPRSLYGASKLCSELLLQEYIDMYSIRGIINRCGVIAGPWQFGKVDQGVFSLWMMAHYFKKPLSYIGFGGKGKQVRDLLHVDDLFNLVDVQAKEIDEFNGRTYNVGGGKQVSLSLEETTDLCQEITGNKIKIETDKETRYADLKIYMTNNERVNRDFNWLPEKNTKDIMQDIFYWVRDQEQNLTLLS